MAKVVINANLVFPSLLISFYSTAWRCIQAKVIQLYGYVLLYDTNVVFLIEIFDIFFSYEMDKGNKYSRNKSLATVVIVHCNMLEVLCSFPNYKVDPIYYTLE